MSSSINPNQSAAAAMARAIAALPPHRPATPAQQNPKPRHTAQQLPPEKSKTNPTPPHPSSPHHPTPSSLLRNPRPLRPNQLTAARLLLAGQPVHAVAAALNLHPYTITRWKQNPLFQSELRRQTDSLARNTAQQKPTPRHTFDSAGAKRTQFQA